MKAHEKNGHHANIRSLAMPKIIRRERLKHGAPCSLLFIPSTKYPRTYTSRSRLYDLFTLLGPIFGFAKYLKQICLSFYPYLELHKSLLEVGEKRCTKGLGEDTNTLSE
jgi:hypothetical protein